MDVCIEDRERPVRGVRKLTHRQCGNQYRAGNRAGELEIHDTAPVTPDAVARMSPVWLSALEVQFIAVACRDAQSVA